MRIQFLRLDSTLAREKGELALPQKQILPCSRARFISPPSLHNLPIGHSDFTRPLSGWEKSTRFPPMLTTAIFQALLLKERAAPATKPPAVSKLNGRANCW